MVSNGIYAPDLSYPRKEEKQQCLIYRVFGQVPARLVLYMLSWSGFLVSFMMRTDINLTIVAMVADPPKTSLNISSEYCYTTDNETSINAHYGGTLQWSERVQSYVLASFYWAYIISQIVGGVATQWLGSKKVFGYSQLVTALCSLNLPWASNTHYGLAIALRFLQGFASGLTWPAMYALVGPWIPIPERSRFMSSFQGFSIGIGITYPLAGYLIANFGWPSVFYTTGSLGVSWCLLWYLLAFDSPETHPRISLSEQKYIKENTANAKIITKEHKTPWWEIVKSPHTWAIGVTTFGRIWVHYTFMIPGPRYMKSILGFSVEKNGLLSGLPFVCSYVASVFFCYLADKLVTKNIMSLLSVRKLMTAIAQVLPGILVLFIGNVGCNIELVLVMWFVAVTVVPAAYAGAMANVVDIAPNFAGPVLAFAQTIHMSASFLSPLAAFHILDGRDLLMSSWRMVFYVTAFVSISTYFFYQIWGTTEIQPWNYVPDLPKQDEQEELMEGKRSDQDAEAGVVKNGTPETDGAVVT
ncbi:sialin [Harmonia axyridis]|uniref:sialin n=1 Tax=Harmonia axyridis TaxID=115357 RepID=UPI001E279062|nr:sialin [Harmonia axyridis]XP_045469678.1 sialin [Harmonia axyridis]XP_045469679.1 sialin [Harmonia axyridis]XP_045469680.1 sialin [Harmonia axyridis]XP_045469681.1 sialin [Harmonia axyridis]XP_045469682.1 sialin [Harmonia axyridis]XP_045469683.1 sialin [Harmonia axyridis]